MVLISLLALAAILVTVAGAGILLTIQHRDHVRAERLAEEEALAEVRELYAAWAMIRARPPGGQGPGVLD